MADIHPGDTVKIVGTVKAVTYYAETEAPEYTVAIPADVPIGTIPLSAHQIELVNGTEKA